MNRQGWVRFRLYLGAGPSCVSKYQSAEGTPVTVET